MPIIQSFGQLQYVENFYNNQHALALLTNLWCVNNNRRC